MLPGTSRAPPIAITSFARRSVAASSAAARARLVSGPSAMIVIVSGGDSARSRSMSLWLGTVEGVNWWWVFAVVWRSTGVAGTDVEGFSVVVGAGGKSKR